MSLETETHQKRAKQILALLQRYVKVLETLHMDTDLKNTQPLLKTLNEQTFKILVVGEFNRGKSTMINALLGEKVLPAYPVETTAIINEVKWNAQKYAILYQGSKQFKIRTEDLEQYVIVKRGQTNPYDKVELFWPLELCKNNGVEIIDSPGLNVISQERLSRTKSYFPSADAVIFVSDAQFAGARSEIDTIETLKSMGHTDILFVCNKINMIAPDEQQMVKADFIDKFADYTRLREKYIFFINARGALDGRISRNERTVRESGIISFEDILSDFLVNERGRIKLLRPSQGARISIQSVIRSLADRKALLQTKRDKFQQEVARAEKRLDEIERYRQMIIMDFQNFRYSKMEKQVQRAAQSFYQDQLRYIDGWANEYKLQSPLTSGEFITNNADARRRVINEVESELTACISSAFKTWEEATLHPLIDREFDAYAIKLNELVRQLIKDFEQLRAEVLQGSGTISSIDIDSRLGAILTQVADNTDNVPNIRFGFGKVLQLALPSGGVFAGLTILAGMAPLIALPIAAVAMIVSLLISKDGVNQRIKQEVGKAYKDQITMKMRDLADKVAETVDMQIEAVQQRLDTTLDREIQSFREHLQNALTAQIQGQTEQKLKELEQCRDELNSINGSIEGIIGQLAIPTSTAGKR